MNHSAAEFQLQRIKKTERGLFAAIEELHTIPFSEPQERLRKDRRIEELKKIYSIALFKY